jgi:stage II sporulation protein D
VSRTLLAKRILQASKAFAVLLALLLTACGHKAQVRPPVAKSKPLPAKTAPPETAPRPAPPVSAAKKPPPPDTGLNPQPAATTASPSVASATVGPLIRIGLTTSAREVRVSAPGRYYLVEKLPESPRRALEGEVSVRVEHEAGRVKDSYRVQVGSLKNRESAEELAAKLTEAFSSHVTVRENPDTGTYQVRVGSFASREEARKFAAGPLRRAGYRDAIIVYEKAAEESGRPTLALRGPKMLRLSKAGFLLVPSEKSEYLKFDGKAYRGQLDVLLNKNGLITVVNQLGVEEYLRGVVPAEMSPSNFPAPAALAAQSVAARTYALKNLGRFAADGFDLTADNRSQVYGGVAQERDAATEAVRNTSGVAIYYQGSLINAMYASTCGGRTEDYGEVFDAPPVPYLRSVACVPESAVSGLPEKDLEGKHEVEGAVFADDGTVANRDLELSQALGIAGAQPLTSDYLAAPASPAEIRDWVDRAASVAHKDARGTSHEGKDIALRGEFIRFAAESLFGSREIEARITAADAAYYLANLKDGGYIPPSSRRALAYLMQAGLWHPCPDNSIRPLEVIRRADALAHLLQWVEHSQPEILRTGLFEAPQDHSSDSNGDPSIAVKWGTNTQRFPLAGNLRLFKISENRSTPTTSLKLIGNEKIRFHLAADGHVDFLEAELNPAGASSDRFSPVATWQVTIPRSVLAEKLRALAGSIGEIRDLKPAKLGASGRAVKIEISGSRRSVIVNGDKLRSALGLKDTLFTIRRTYDPAGMAESFTFNGRGWGHGVGLCQVGAYGMARAGSTYEEILKTYYQGVELRKTY